MKFIDPASALEPHELRVRSEWIDYNGHLNLAYYIVAFDQGVDKLFEIIGIGLDYRKTDELGTFAAETHTLYEREVKDGDPLRIVCHILAVDDKRMHMFLEMFHAEENYRAAAQEILYLHVDLKIRRVSPWPDDIRAKIDSLAVHCAQSLLPPGVGRKITMPSPKKP
ncbi:MAG: thioesterase [Acetobacteraceae bacterium]|nr:thioesterase [Acetobacteraceae bacterium]